MAAQCHSVQVILSHASATVWTTLHHGLKTKRNHIIRGMIFQKYTFQTNIKKQNVNNCTFNSQGDELILMNINKDDVCGRAVPLVKSKVLTQQCPDIISFTG